MEIWEGLECGKEGNVAISEGRVMGRKGLWWGAYGNVESRNPVNFLRKSRHPVIFLENTDTVTYFRQSLIM